jgi:hypothetical protein
MKMNGKQTYDRNYPLKYLAFLTKIILPSKMLHGIYQWKKLPIENGKA